MLKKTDDFLGRYSRICPIARLLSPVFTAAFYVCAALAAVTVIVAFIVLLVNVEVEKMLLPPGMQAIRDTAGAVTEYSLDLGNGIKIISAADSVTLSHIKTVIYADLASLFLLLCVICPVCRFMALLMKNVGRKEALNEENARMINYIGIVVLVGNTLVTALNNLFNYVQINKFITAADRRIEYVFSIEWAGIITGIFIIVVGTIYGYACSVAAQNGLHTSALTEYEENGGSNGK